MKKILIIDDEPDTITFLRTWLEDNGYATCSAVDGEQGLRALREERPDLVLMDLKMPNQTGFQLYREIRLDEALKNIPVIFITGLSDYQLFDNDCNPLPLPAHIDKPINLDDLLSAIERALAV